jgi:MtN3 and saliva related transmembrane protein
MNLAEVIGAVAALLTTAAFVPQAFKVLRTRETAAISLTMYALFTAGVALWLAYGIITVQWSITIANAITLALAALILGVKLRSLKRGPQT